MIRTQESDGTLVCPHCGERPDIGYVEPAAQLTYDDGYFVIRHGKYERTGQNIRALVTGWNNRCIAARVLRAFTRPFRRMIHNAAD